MRLQLPRLPFLLTFGRMDSRRYQKSPLLRAVVGSGFGSDVDAFERWRVLIS